MSDYAVILCARYNSERLPGKALAELAPGVPVLNQIIGRWAQSTRSPSIIVATPDGAENDPIAQSASTCGVPCSRKEPGNPVAEMDAALRRYAPRARYVARALADNPLVDVALADWRLDKLREAGADGLWYGVEIDQAGRWHGLHERITYAGTTDVWSRRAWDEIAANSSGSQLMHPGAWWWNTIRSNKKSRILPLPRDEYLSLLRTELDEAADLAVLRAVWAAWAAAGYSSPLVDTLWALRYLHAHPEVAALNRGVALKTQTAVGERHTRRPRYCAGCRAEMGQISPNGLEDRCARCGGGMTYYHQKPKR